MKKIALNYLYLSHSHAGGKDQVGLNLLRGLYENGVSKQYLILCYDYSYQTLHDIAPDAEYCTVKSNNTTGELKRLLALGINNTFLVPKLLKQHQVNVVYHLSCMNGLRKMPCKSVVIPHDIKAVSHRVLGTVKIPFYKYIIYKIMYATDFRHADVVIAISDTDKKEISQYYPKYASKVKRIYNPIITCTAEPAAKRQGDYICALNLQFHHKNIITLIKAAELLKDKPDCKLILMGSVPARVQYLKDYVAEHQLEDRVEFAGFVSDQKAKEIMQNSWLYVNPSLNEGFGMTAVEALMLCVPTLLSDIPTNREVTQNLCTYYSPLQDAQALATAIEKCHEDPPSQLQLEQARQAMIDAYDYRAISRQYDTLFHSFV